MHRGSETVLGDAASECELFVGQEWEEASLPEVVAVVCAKRLAREWDPDLRARHFGEDEALRARNEELRKQGGWLVVLMGNGRCHQLWVLARFCNLHVVWCSYPNVDTLIFHVTSVHGGCYFLLLVLRYASTYICMAAGTITQHLCTCAAWLQV